MGYVVLTSVDRDDLPDGGAEHFAKTVRIGGALLHAWHALPARLPMRRPCRTCARVLVGFSMPECIARPPRPGCAPRPSPPFAWQVRTLKALKPSILIECLTPDFRCGRHVARVDILRCTWTAAEPSMLLRNLCTMPVQLLTARPACAAHAAGATWRLCATWHAAVWTSLPTTWRR